MLTRLTVRGFKNLVDVDMSFGPLTCIAGKNASGKSNLFDAIRFLSFLSESSLSEAAARVRSLTGGTPDARSLFTQHLFGTQPTMRFVAEMVIPRRGVDDLGQAAEARVTFVRYSLSLGYRSPEESESRSELEILSEELDFIRVGDARKHLDFPHSAAWRRSAVHGGPRNVPFISTEMGDNGRAVVKLHQEGRQGRPRLHDAARLPRTVLSSSSAAETPTALLAKREMQSWRLLQLEPGALREPDSFREQPRLAVDGRHLPATIQRLTRGASAGIDGGDFLATLANRLALLIDDVGEVRIERDDARELYSLWVTDRFGMRHSARSLSDGTLRFLALATLEADPEFAGVVCLEEPENGIHPDRIPAMVALLHDLAVSTDEAVSEENPLRQVVVNTHSPGVVGYVYDDELLLAETRLVQGASSQVPAVKFQWLDGTWRAKANPSIRPLSKGRLLAYLAPHQPATEMGPRLTDVGPLRRVADREDLSQLKLRLEGEVGG